jgi:YD repeat-containing protein
MRKCVFYFLFLFIFKNTLEAQDEAYKDINFSPPSPTAYELGKFGELPIGLFTGTVNIPIPLLEFKSKIPVSISLNYSSNGIMVDQLSTKVGLGWNLNAGGVISRTVKGNPDELRINPHPSVTSSTADFFTTEWIEYYNDVIGQSVGGISLPLGFDFEPDIFSFNFMGRTGRFTYNNQGQIVLLDNYSLKVVYNPENSGGFLIIDEQGNKFFFLEEENTTIHSVGGSPSLNNIRRKMPTSWSLTRIENTSGDITYFEYTSEDYDYIASQTQFVTIKSSPSQIYANTACSNSQYSPPYVSPVIDNQMVIEGKRLYRIHSNNPTSGSVVFEYDQSHPEVENYSLLTKIKYLNSDDIVIDEIGLEYNSVSQRMFLDRIQFQDENNNYSFEYVDNFRLPNRLSYGKDHWGYYNGAVNRSLYPDLSGLNGIPGYGNLGDRFESIPDANGANKNLNEDKSKLGLLEKITYPTKGYTIIDYESNSYNTIEETPNNTSVFAEVATSTSVRNDTEIITLQNIYENKLVPVNIYFTANYRDCLSTGEDFPNPVDRKLHITIENLTTSQNNIIRKDIGSTDPINLGNNTYVTEREEGTYLFYLLAGHEYKITLQLFYKCLLGNLRFSYPNSAPTINYLDKKTGGLRVSKMTNYDTNNSIINSKKYFYAKKEELDKSSGLMPNYPDYISDFNVGGGCQLLSSLYNWVQNYKRLNSESIRTLYKSSNQTATYRYVTISEDTEDFTNGGIEHKFRIASLNAAYYIKGNYNNIFYEGKNSWGNGLEIRKTYFKKEGGTFKNIRKEHNNYVRDNRLDNTIQGFSVAFNYMVAYFPGTGDYETDLYNKALMRLSVTRYLIENNWFYLDSKIIEDYDLNGENPIVTTTNYSYDNSNHAQITRVKTSTSKLERLITKTFYPDDVGTQDALGADDLSVSEKSSIDRLKNDDLHKIATPIQTETYIDSNNNGVADVSELLSIQRTNYRDWGNGIVLPKDIKTLKGPYNITNNTLQGRVVYHSYDSRGNPTEISKVNGMHVVYIWGYDSQYPVAKIENATYAQVSNLVENIKSKSNADNDRTLHYLGKEGDLRQALDNLRATLPNAMVNTYTYDPHIGVTSMTDPKGYTTYYEYDEFNRLSKVKDANGNLLSENKYNYKN